MSIGIGEVTCICTESNNTYFAKIQNKMINTFVWWSVVLLKELSRIVKENEYFNGWMDDEWTDGWQVDG